MSRNAVSVKGPDGLNFIWVGGTQEDGDLVHLCDEEMTRIFSIPSVWVSPVSRAQEAEMVK